MLPFLLMLPSIGPTYPEGGPDSPCPVDVVSPSAPTPLTWECQPVPLSRTHSFPISLAECISCIRSFDLIQCKKSGDCLTMATKHHKRTAARGDRLHLPPSSCQNICCRCHSSCLLSRQGRGYPLTLALLQFIELLHKNIKTSNCPIHSCQF